MSKKFHKIDKEFQLTDSTENCYGFRLLTSGYQLADFAKNPIGYYMHDREQGVLLKWEDLRMEGDAVYGKPVINLSHPRSSQTVDEIESGFLNAASVGHIVALEISSDPADYLPNQKGPTVKKWFNRECSIVDVPGNYNSVTLTDENDKLINLADFTLEIKDMNKIQWTAAMLMAVGLSAEASEAEVTTAFNDLVAKANKATGLEKELNDLKAATVAKEVSDLIAQAIDAKKMTVALGAKFAKDYATNPTGLKDLIADLPVYTSISAAAASDPKAKRLEDLMAKDYKTLDKEGLLIELKALSPVEFASKQEAYIQSLSK